MFKKLGSNIPNHVILDIGKRHIIYIKKDIFQELTQNQNYTEHFQLSQLGTAADELVG